MKFIFGTKEGGQLQLQMEGREYYKVAIATEIQFKPDPLDWKFADSVAGGWWCVWSSVCVGSVAKLQVIR